MPELRSLRGQACGESGKRARQRLAENAPMQSPPRPFRAQSAASPLASLPSAPTQAAAASRTRGAVERGTLQAAALPCLREMGLAGLAELGADLTSEQLAALLTGHSAIEGRAAALVTALQVPTRVLLADATLADEATLAAMVKGYGGDTPEARLASRNLEVARAAVEGLSEGEQLSLLDTLGERLMGQLAARQCPCAPP